jgi:benzoate/toluate 1,2-dioxygenase reductase component
MSCGGGTLQAAALSRRTWLSKGTFELELERPPGFDFLPGQGICLGEGREEREYSLCSGRQEPRLALCVRRVENGVLSSRLAEVPLGHQIAFSGPHGLFTYQASPRHAVFVATGTGAAPFESMARSGCRGFTILHGVRTAEELYYGESLRAAALRYIPCLSAGAAPGGFAGRVTDWVRTQLASGAYDFYLCGRREMVRDMTSLVDGSFPGSRVYAEIFY